MSDRAALERETQNLAWRFSAWRRSHKPPTPVPARLWGDAVKLAARQGVGRTARALGLNQTALKAAVSGSDLAPAAQFEEIACAPGNVVECFAEIGITTTGGGEDGELTLEVESPGGAKMSIRARKVAPAALLELIRGFAS